MLLKSSFDSNGHKTLYHLQWTQEKQFIKNYFLSLLEKKKSKNFSLTIITARFWFLKFCSKKTDASLVFLKTLKEENSTGYRKIVSSKFAELFGCEM